MHKFTNVFRVVPGVELSWTASLEGILGGLEAQTTSTAGQKIVIAERNFSHGNEIEYIMNIFSQGPARHLCSHLESREGVFWVSF